MSVLAVGPTVPTVEEVVFETVATGEEEAPPRRVVQQSWPSLRQVEAPHTPQQDWRDEHSELQSRTDDRNSSSQTHD